MTLHVREDGIVNAERLMRLADAGEHSPRVPIDVRRREDGRFDVVDGNSTVAVARIFGWHDIFAIEVPA